MDEFRFDQCVSLNMIEHANDINFSYHINSFDFPTRHSHKNYWEFTIVLEGMFYNYSDNGQFACPAGTLLISTTKGSHFIINGSGQPLRYANLVVKEQYVINTLTIIAPYLLAEIQSGKLHYSLSDTIISEIESLLLNTELEDIKQTEKNQELFCSAFLLIISAIIASVSNHTNHIIKWEEKLNKVIREDNYLTLTTNELCKKMNYSRTQLNALFKKHYKTTPHEFLKHLKFDHATYLLMNTDMTITEISEKLGYVTPAPFYNAFKKIYGVSPYQYKKQLEIYTNKEKTS